MIYGVTLNPLPLCEWIKQNNVWIGINKPIFLCRNILFTNLILMKRLKNKIKRSRIIIFDSIENLMTIKNVQIVNTLEKQEMLKQELLNKNFETSSEEIEFLKIDYIHNIINGNKNVGLMHIYNTARYSIPDKDLREIITKSILSFVSGEVSLDTICKDLQSRVENKRAGKIKSTILDIINLVRTDEFQRIRQAVVKLRETKAKVDRQLIESVSLTFTVHPYDVNYMYAVLTKGKGEIK